MRQTFKSILLFFFASAILSLFMGVSAAEDLQTGFGGINWKTSLDQIRDCERIEGKEGIQYCLRRDQTHSLLGEPAPNVLYGFYQDSFFVVLMRIEDDDAYAHTKNRLLERLGAPETSFDKKGVASTLRWTEGQVRIELFNDRSKEGFMLAYYYLPLYQKVLRQHKNLAPSKWSNIKMFPVKKDDDPEAVRILEF